MDKDRIKQMAVEAGFDADDGEITAPLATITGDPMDVTEQVTKLAQAVARECAALADNSDFGPVPHHIGDQIRARFGLGE